MTRVMLLRPTRCVGMRWLLFACLLGACDPVWHVGNVTTPATPTTDACIDTALHATTFTISTMGVPSGKRGWYVRSPGHELRVTWDPSQHQTLTLVTMGVGTDAPPNTLDAYRSMRDTVLAKVREQCGPVDAGVEQCARMQCDSRPR